MFITGGIKETPETALTGRRLFPVDYLPDVEEKSYHYRYYIHIIETKRTVRVIFKRQRIRHPQIFHVHISPGARIFHPFPQDRMRVNGRI